MTDRELLQQALDALRRIGEYGDIYRYKSTELSPYTQIYEAVTALEAALAQPEQEPKLSDAGADTNIVRGLEPKGDGMVVLHQREWVGLTDDAIAKTQIDFDLRGLYRYTRAIEAQCKELNR